METKLDLSLETIVDAAPQRSGDLCPRCRAGHMDYDGMLNLACSKCGYVFIESSACT